MQADACNETYANVKQLIQLMKFPELDREFTFTGDLKMVNIMLGLSSCSCSFPCPYCEGAKWAKNAKGKLAVTNKFGRFVRARERTLENIKLNQRNFIIKGGVNAKKYKNCVREVISLWNNDMDHVSVLSRFPIDPLHVILLGTVLFI